jgi:hypothetical protein
VIVTTSGGASGAATTSADGRSGAVHLIDRLVLVGSVGEGTAIRRRSQARRRAYKADAQADQRCEEDCTHC